MTTSHAASVPTHATAAGVTSSGLAVFAVIGATGAAAYLSTFFVYGAATLSPVDLFNAPLVLTAQWLMVVGLGGMGMLLPAVVGQRLPQWAVWTAAGSFIASAAMSFTIGSVLAEATRLVNETEFEAFVGYPLVVATGIIHGVLGLVGCLAIAVTGKRRQLFGWGTTVLFVLAALTACLWHVPPGALFGALAVLALLQSLRLKTESSLGANT